MSELLALGLMTPIQVANKYHISLSLVYKLIADQKLEPIVAGRKGYLIPLDQMSRQSVKGSVAEAHKRRRMKAEKA